MSRTLVCLLFACAISLTACAARPTATVAMPSMTAPSTERAPTAAPSPTATPAPSPTPTPAWPVGMEALGDTARQMVENATPHRWEYRGESGADQAVAYWDDGERRLRLVDGVTSLDLAKHAGLFVRWAPARVETAYAASNGKSVPVLAAPERGTLCEGKGNRYGIGLGELPPGTVVRSPLIAVVGRSVIQTAGSPDIHLFSLADQATAKEMLRVFASANLEEITMPSAAAGDMLFRTAGVRLVIANPCGAVSELMFTNADESDPGTRLVDLMRDELGRIVMIGE